MKDKFKLIKPFGGYKSGKIFDSFGGLVSGIHCDEIKQNVNFDNKEYFKLLTDVKVKTKSQNDPKPTLSPSDVRWVPRYSSTMEDDDMGRWARVAYAGKFDNMGSWRGKICRWEIAWVNKLDIKGELKFKISYFYPSSGKYLFDNLEDAQKEVEQTFRWFIKMCVGKISLR